MEGKESSLLQRTLQLLVSKMSLSLLYYRLLNSNATRKSHEHDTP